VEIILSCNHFFIQLEKEKKEKRKKKKKKKKELLGYPNWENLKKQFVDLVSWENKSSLRTGK
jgi:hypothetical protein